MKGFSLDFNDTFEGGHIEDGTYEVVVNKVGEGATPGGAEYIEFNLIIRNDIDQKHKNQHIFHKVWKVKDTGKYNMKTFNTIGKACQLQNGKSYKSLEELMTDYVRKTAVVNVKNEESEYNGKTYNNLNVKYWNATKFTNLQHQFKAEGESKGSNDTFGGQTTTLDPDDLPF